MFFRFFICIFWSNPQTTILDMTPLSLLAYLLNSQSVLNLFLRLILLKFRNYFPADSSQPEAAILKFKFGALSSEYPFCALAAN